MIPFFMPNVSILDKFQTEFDADFKNFHTTSSLFDKDTSSRRFFQPIF